MRVCYFGAYRPDYPRNAILRRGLAAHDVRIVECNVSPLLPTVRKVVPLVRQFQAVKSQCDLILVAEFGQSLAPLAWALARTSGKRLVVDMLLPLYESRVWDRRSVRPGSVGAARFYLTDYLAVHLADCVLADTPPHRTKLARDYRAPESKFAVVPLGADESLFAPRPVEARGDGRLLVQYYGTYVPAHGVDCMLRAIKLLEARTALVFEFIGRGQTYSMARALAEDLRLSQVTFSDPVPLPELPDRVARADISLGEFADVPTVRYGLANKVFQTLMMRRPLINADTPAIRSLFSDGEHLRLCRIANPQALAEAIVALAEDPALRARLGDGGHRHVLEHYTPQPLGGRLLAELRRLMEPRAGDRQAATHGL